MNLASSKFKLVNSLKPFNCAFVRPVLEYGSAVWDPRDFEDNRQWQRAWSKFLKFVSFTIP